jgi:hypothetical protein
MRQRRGARALAGAIALIGLAASPAPTEPPPALVALLLDSSGSLRPQELERARVLAGEVLQGLPQGSQVAVFTFDDQSRLVLPRTSEAAQVRDALAAVRISGRHTALHDALYDASRYLRDAGVARSAILLVTDGKDERSTLDLDDGLRLAQESGIPVFAVGVGRVEERGLRRIAKLTGGRYYGAGEASGAALVSAMMAAPSAEPERKAAPAPAPSATSAVSAPVRATRGEAPRAAAPSGILRLLPVLAALVVAAAIAATWAARRSRGREAAVVEPAGTIVARIGGTTEEYLEKTVVLRERAVLAVTRGPLAGQVFDLSPTSATSLGRSKANDLVLDDVSVSSQHCRIRPEDAAFTLIDMKSTNGTFVNERRVSSHKLAEGDVIRVGEVQLQFRTDQRRG